MAITYDPVTLTPIEISGTFRTLMSASTGIDSIFLRAKEMLLDSMSELSISQSEKATLVANTIATMANGVTAQAMEMAFKIDTENRNGVYGLTKMHEDTRLVTANVAKVEADTARVNAEVKAVTFNNWKGQAELYRDYGVTTYNLTTATDIVPLVDYIDYGIKTETIKKAKADVYNTYSSGYRTNGYVALALNNDGSIASGTTGDTTGLSYWQTKVANRQYAAFDDNKYQHVVNSSSSMISMLLSTGENLDYTAALAKWTTASGYLVTPTA